MSRVYQYLPQHLQQIARQNGWSDDEAAAAIHQSRLSYYGDDLRGSPDLEDTRESIGLGRRGFLGKAIDSSASGFSDLVFDAPFRTIGGAITAVGDITGIDAVENYGKDLALRNQMDPNPSDGFAELLGRAPVEIARFGLALAPFIGPASRAAAMTATGARSFIAGSSARKAAYVMGTAMLSSEYGRYRAAEEIDPARAAVGAGLMTAAEFFSDRLTLGALSTGKFLSNSSFQKFLGDRLGMIGNKIGGRTSAILATSATAAITEAITEFLQGGIDEGIINPESTIGSVLDAAANPEAITKAFVLGGLVGGGLGSINQGVSAYLDAVYPHIDGAPTNSDRDATDPRETKYDQTRRTRQEQPESDTEASVAEAHAKAEKARKEEEINSKKADFAAKTSAFDPNIDIKFDPGPDQSTFGERTGDNVHKPKMPEGGYFSADLLRKTLSEIVGTDIVNVFNRDYMKYTKSKPRHEQTEEERLTGQKDPVDTFDASAPNSDRLHLPANTTQDRANVEFFDRVINARRRTEEDQIIQDLIDYMPEMGSEQYNYLQDIFLQEYPFEGVHQPDFKKLRKVMDQHIKDSPGKNVSLQNENIIESIPFILQEFISNEASDIFIDNYGKAITLNERHNQLRSFIDNELTEALEGVQFVNNYGVSWDIDKSEFLDLSIRRPDMAKKIAPEAYKAFEKYMKEDEILGPLLKQHQELSSQFELQPEWYKAKLAPGQPATELQKLMLRHLKEYKSYLNRDEPRSLNPITMDVKDQILVEKGTKIAHAVSKRNIWMDIAAKWGIPRAEEKQSLLASSEGLASIMFQEGTTSLDPAKGWQPNASASMAPSEFYNKTDRRQIDSIDRVEQDMFAAAQNMAEVEGGNAHEIFHDTWAAMVMENAQRAIKSKRLQNRIVRNKIDTTPIESMVIPKIILPENLREEYADRIHKQVDRLVTQLGKFGRYQPNLRNRIQDRSKDGTFRGFRFLAPLRTREQTKNDGSLFGILGLPNLQDSSQRDLKYEIPDGYTGIRKLISDLVYMTNQQMITEDVVHKLAQLGPAHASIVTIAPGAPQNRPRSTEGEYVLSYWGYLGKHNQGDNTFEYDPSKTIEVFNKKTEEFEERTLHKTHYWITIHNKDFVEAMRTLPRIYYGPVYRGFARGRKFITGMITNAPKFIGIAFARAFPESHATTNVLDYDFFKAAHMVPEMTEHIWSKNRDNWDYPEKRERDPETGMPIFTKEKPVTFRELMYSGAMYSGVSGINIRSDVEPGVLKAGQFWRPRKPLSSMVDAFNALMDKITIPSQLAETMPRLSAAIQKLEEGGTWMDAGNTATITGVDFKNQPSVRWLRNITNLFIFMGAQINSLNRWGNILFTNHNHKLSLSDLYSLSDEDIKILNEKSPGAAEFLEVRKRAYAIGSLMAVMTAAIFIWNNEDDERRERYRNLSAEDKARYWNIFIGDEHIKLPLPHEVAFGWVMPTTIALDVMFDNPDKEILNAFGSATQLLFLPETVPTVIAPIYRNVTNRRYGGTQVVPDYMKDRPDEYQYFAHTSTLYKAIGKQFGWSPLKVEIIMGGYLGYFNDIIEAASDRLVWDEDVSGEKPFNDIVFELTGISGFIRNERQSINRWTREYAFMLDRAQSAKANLDEMMNEYALTGKKPDQDDYDNNRKMASILSFFRDTIKLAASTNRQVMIISHNKNLSKKEKEERIIALYKILNQQKEDDYRRALRELEDLEESIFEWSENNWKSQNKY